MSRYLFIIFCFCCCCLAASVSAQQRALLADLSLSPAGAWTFEQLSPLSQTVAAPGSGILLPTPANPLRARAVHSVSRQPLLGVEVEIVAASVSAGVYLNWTSIDASTGINRAPVLPIFVNNRNFTDNDGYAYFPMLAPLRGCFPGDTQLVARAVFNTSARSPIHSNVASQVRLQVVPSRSACTGRILALSESEPTASATPNDGRVLLRILREVTRITDVATMLPLRETILSCVRAQQLAAAAATTTTTAAASAPSSATSTAATAASSSGTVTTGTDPTAASSTSAASSPTTATTQPPATTATGGAGDSSSPTQPSQSALVSYPPVSFDVTAGYSVPVRSVVLDTCGRVTSGFVMADRAQPAVSSTSNAGGDAAATTSSTAAAATTTSAAAGAGVGSLAGDDGTASSSIGGGATLSEAAKTSVLRNGWVSGAMIYETQAAAAATSVACFDWTVLTREIGAIQANFFLPHNVDRFSLQTAALAFAEFVTSPPFRNMSAMEHTCDAQTIAVTPVAVPPSVYGAPKLLQNESRPLFEVQQSSSLSELLRGAGALQEYTVIEAYSRALNGASPTTTPATVPNPVPSWLYIQSSSSSSSSPSPIAVGTATTTAAAAASFPPSPAPSSGTATPNTNNNNNNQNRMTIDQLRGAITRLSVSLPLAATSASTLRGALSIRSLDVSTTAPRGVELLALYLRSVSQTTTPVTVETRFSVLLETVSVTLPEIDDTVTVKLQFTRQNPVALLDLRVLPDKPLSTLHASFVFRQDVIFHGSSSILSLLPDRVLMQIAGSPLILTGGGAPGASTTAAAFGAATIAATTTLDLAFASGGTTAAASSQQQAKREYAFVATSVALPTANATATVLPSHDAFFSARAAMDYISFLSLFGRKFDASIVGVTRFATRTCSSDTYTRYDASLHPLQFVIDPLKQGPGLNYAISVLVGNFIMIFIVLGLETLVYFAAGRDVSSFPLHTMRVSKFLYAGTALAMVHALHFGPNIAVTFAGGLVSFVFMLGVPIALAALALRAQLSWKSVFIFQPTKADQKKAMLLQRHHGGADDTLSLMKNRMLITLGFSDAAFLNKEDVIRSESAAAESVHLGWIGFVLSRLFLPPGHYMLKHRDHFRARPVYERYRSDPTSKLLWLFSVAEMIFQLLLAMSYSFGGGQCTVRLALVVTLHAVKLAGLMLLLPLITVMDNLIAIVTSSVLIAAIVFDIREDTTRADVSFAACSVLFGISNLLDATCAVMSSRHVVGWAILLKQKAAAAFNKFGGPPHFRRLRGWCVFGMILLILRQREAGIDLSLDRKQIRAMLLRGGEDTVQQVKSEQQLEEEQELRREERKRVRREQGLESEDGVDEELLTVRHRDLNEDASATFLFQDDDILTEEERKVRNILAMDARSASEASIGSEKKNNNSNNNNNNNSERSISGDGIGSKLAAPPALRAKSPTQQQQQQQQQGELNLSDPDVDMEAFFDQVAREFASQGNMSSKWGKRPGGVTPVHPNRWGESPARSQDGNNNNNRSRSQSPAASATAAEAAERRERERRLQVLDDAHLLDRFLKGDEAALDHTLTAQMNRPWIDASLLHPSSPSAISTSTESYKMNKALAAAEAKTRRIMEERQVKHEMEIMTMKQTATGGRVVGSSPTSSAAFGPAPSPPPKLLKATNVDDDQIDLSNDPLFADNNNNNNDSGKRQQPSPVGGAAAAATAITPIPDGEIAPLTLEQQREIFFTINPQFRHLRPAVPTTIAAAAAIAAETASPTATAGNHAAIARASSPAAIAAAAAAAAAPKSKAELATEQRLADEREAELYQLRHFYHNCGPTAQREVDSVLGPIEQSLHEKGLFSPVISEIREPIETNNTGHFAASASFASAAAFLTNLSSHLSMEEEIVIDKNMKRMLEMEKNPNVYVPAFVWESEEHQRRFERCVSLHPMLSSALNPAGGRFVSRVATMPDGTMAHNVSRLRVRKITEVEDSIGNPISGRVVVDHPTVEIANCPPAASQHQQQQRKKSKAKNNIKNMLLAHMFEEGNIGDGVLVETEVLRRRRRNTKRRERLASGMSAEQIAIIETSSDESDGEKPIALREGGAGDSDDDDIGVAAAQSHRTAKDVRNNPIMDKTGITTTRSGGNAKGKPRNQLQDVFREGDRRDRKLARTTFGTDSMMAQARVLALNGDTMKLAELSQYDPNWFKNGRSIMEEAMTMQFVGSESLAVAAAVAENLPPAPKPLLKICVGEDVVPDENEKERKLFQRITSRTTAASPAVSPGRGMSSPTSAKKSVHGNTFIPRMSREKPKPPATSQLR